jgi:hypothetical protein
MEYAILYCLKTDTGIAHTTYFTTKNHTARFVSSSINEENEPSAHDAKHIYVHTDSEYIIHRIHYYENNTL